MCTKPKASYSVQYKYVYRYNPTGVEICFMRTVLIFFFG